MDWNQEIVNSLIWLAEFFAGSCVVFAAVVWALSRFTRWGRQLAALAWPYFNPRRSWRPLLLLALVLLLAMAAVRVNVLFSFWYQGMYSALQAMDQKAFWFYMALFGILAVVHVVRALVNYLVQQVFDIRWRTALNDQLLGDWLADDAFYRGRFVDPPVDNPDQRIQVDITNFVTASRTLSIGVAENVVSLISFTGILWGLSGPLAVFGVVVPRALVFLVYVYVLVATVLAFKLGRPLIRLNFLSEQLGANFRYALVRLREYAENVAFYQGAEPERRTLDRRFAAVIKNAWGIIFRTLKFDGFNLIASQGAVVFPFILQAPRYFAGTIKLGDLIQTSQSFGQLADALSFFRTSYDGFAQYRATLERLSGFTEANAKAKALPSVVTRERDDALLIDRLDVSRPDGGVLVRGLQLQVRPGEALLVQGASGSGKTTLLRSLAGLWPYAGGTVQRPLGHHALFLSQRPYLPLGTLRAALAYPATAADDSAVRTALSQVQLGHLEARLDLEADWSSILSLGEQQRLAFARVLVNRPQIAFLDEATSATDEGLEHALYTLLRRELPQCVLVSVGHRSTLHAFHTHRLALAAEGRWSLQASEVPA